MEQPEFVNGTSDRAASLPAESNVTPVSRVEPELAMSYCPVCSTRLASRSCKLICPGCGLNSGKSMRLVLNGKKRKNNFEEKPNCSPEVRKLLIV